MESNTDRRQPGVRRIFYRMPKLDLYVFREFMIPFSVLIFAFVLLFLIADVFNDLSEFLDNEASAWTAVRYFALKMPEKIRFVLPITILLSSMYTLANFGRHREITAMRASGISLFRIGVPIYAFALLMTFANFWFNENLAAKCTQEAIRLFRSIGDDEKDQKDTMFVQYNTTDYKRNWMFGKFDSEGVQSNVRIKFFDETKDEKGNMIRRTVRQIDARQVDFIPGKGWKFIDGSDRTYAENGLMSSKKDVRELLLPREEAPETPDMVLKSVSSPENLSAHGIWQFLHENPDLVKPIRVIYESYLYYHLAFPWACFLCAFLALPLAAKNERSGIFVAIIVAVAVIVVYQIMSDVFLTMGRRGELNPFLAGALPTLVFAGYGFYLVRKSG